MANNEEGRQTAVATEVAESARTLAHSTRTVPRPLDSYELLGTLHEAQASLAQVYEQLAGWHGGVVDGVDYDGEDGRGIEGIPAVGENGQTVAMLRMAARSAEETAELLNKAFAANSVVCWRD